MNLFRKISETVSKGVSTATEKAQQTVEITRLHSQISGKRKEIDKLFEEIGEAVFEGYLAKDLSLAESRVIPTCEEVVAIRIEIETLDERIMQLRNEKECTCGKKMPYDTRFCPACGQPFPEPEVAAEPAAPKENNIGYTGDFPSADPFAEPPGFKEPSDSPSASDWADVGQPRSTGDADSGWMEAERTAPDGSDAGLPSRDERSSASEWMEPAPSVRTHLTDPQPAQEPNSDGSDCPNCGKSNLPSVRFCPSCGTPQPNH